MRGRQYKDVFAASGSQLYEVLEAGDLKKADEIYQVCKKEFEKFWPADKMHLLNWKIGNKEE